LKDKAKAFANVDPALVHLSVRDRRGCERPRQVTDAVSRWSISGTVRRRRRPLSRQRAQFAGGLNAENAQFIKSGLKELRK